MLPPIRDTYSFVLVRRVGMLAGSTTTAFSPTTFWVDVASSALAMQSCMRRATCWLRKLSTSTVSSSSATFCCRSTTAVVLEGSKLCFLCCYFNSY